MRFFPILEELFSSDSVLFMVIGLLIAVFIGLKGKAMRKSIIGLLAGFLIYAFCELLSNFHTNYMLELLLLFVGTAALGAVVGFLIGIIVLKSKK